MLFATACCNAKKTNLNRICIISGTKQEIVKATEVTNQPVIEITEQVVN